MTFATDSFKARGYQIFRGIVTASRIAAIRALLEQKLASSLEALQPLGIRTETQHLSEDIQNLLARPDGNEIDRDLRTIMTGHYPLDIRLNEILWEIPRDENVQELLKAMLDSKSLRMHMPPTARFVLPNNVAAGVPAHQDVSYNRHLSDFVTMWVPLVEIDQSCGGVTVFETSETMELPTKLSNYGIWNEELKTGCSEAIDCTPMRPGDVLVFNKFMVHRSMPNISDRIRFSVDYRFFRMSDTSQKHYLDMQSWQVIAPVLP